MALYYNLTQLIAATEDDSMLLKEQIMYHVELLELRLEKLIKAVSKKKYDKVAKHILKIQPTVIVLDLQEANHFTEALLEWKMREGKKSEGIEMVQALKKSLQKTLKELKRDFSLI